MNIKSQSLNTIELQEQVDKAYRSELKIELKFNEPINYAHINEYLSHLIMMRKRIASNIIHGNAPNGSLEVFERYNQEIKDVIGL